MVVVSYQPFAGISGFRPALKIAPCIFSTSTLLGGRAGMTDIFH
jgi:hypothetical protein